MQCHHQSPSELYDATDMLGSLQFCFSQHQVDQLEDTDLDRAQSITLQNNMY